MLKAFRITMDNLDGRPIEIQRGIMHALFSGIEILPEPQPGGQRVRSVRFRFPVSLDGKPAGYDLGVYYDGDDDGGGMPRPESPGSPSGGNMPQQEDAPSSMDIAHAGSFLLTATTVSPVTGCGNANR